MSILVPSPGGALTLPGAGHYLEQPHGLGKTKLVVEVARGEVKGKNEAHLWGWEAVSEMEIEGRTGEGGRVYSQHLPDASGEAK